jgi:hypothetical protein
MSMMKNFLENVQELLEAGYSIEDIQKELKCSFELVEQAVEFWSDYSE